MPICIECGKILPIKTAKRCRKCNNKLMGKLLQSHRYKGPIWNKGTKGIVKAWNKGKKYIQASIRMKGNQIWKLKKSFNVSEETKKKISEANIGRLPWNKGKENLSSKGEKNVNWKGGITPINEKIRKSIEYKLWRESIFMRD